MSNNYHKENNNGGMDMLSEVYPVKGWSSAERQKAAGLEATLGRDIDWHNITHDWHKAGDVEILSATVYDSEFLAMHHRVRDILDANAILRDTNKKIRLSDNQVIHAKALSNKEILENILNGRESVITFVDDLGREVPDLKIDPKRYSQLLKMLNFNKLMGEYGKTEGEIEQLFFNGKPIEIELPAAQDKKGNPLPPRKIDYYKACPIDDLKDFNSQKYLSKVEKYQVGLQSMGNLRDEALKGLHPENAGHVQFVMIDVGGEQKALWMPTSAKIAQDYVSADMRKISPATLAKFHVHGIGNYDENTSTCVAFNYNILQSQRKSINGDRDFRDTNDRTTSNFMALASGEIPVLSKEKLTFKDANKVEKTSEVKVINFGGKKVYDAMRNTYDEAMELARGFGITDKEASDKIMTDILIPVLINNPRDWIMSFARVFGPKVGMDISESLKQGITDVWSDRKSHSFAIAMDCKEVEGEDKGKIVRKYFTSLSELLAYANLRIGAGEVSGVPSDTVGEAHAITPEEEEAQRKADEEDKKKAEEAKEKEIKELDAAKLRAYTDLLKAVFGASLNPYLRAYWEYGAYLPVEHGVAKSAEFGPQKKVVDIKRKPKLDANGKPIIDATGKVVYDEIDPSGLVYGDGRQEFTVHLRKMLQTDLAKFSSLITAASGASSAQLGIDTVSETLNNLSNDGRKKLYEYAIPPEMRMSEAPQGFETLDKGSFMKKENQAPLPNKEDKK